MKETAQSHWAQPTERVQARGIPADAINLNMEGRRLTGALQGFGPLWEKTYRIRLAGVARTPAEVMAVWRENFARFQPHEVHFHPPASGVQPGALMPIDFLLPIIPGLPEIIPMASGVEVIYSDDTSFTVMTVEGFPISGWNTFSIVEEDGCPVAVVYSLLRMTDPVYELGYRLMGGAKKQEKDWHTVLTNLAAHFGVQGTVEMKSACLDHRYQWREARNIWLNAAIRTFFYQFTVPPRRLARWLQAKRQS